MKNINKKLVSIVAAFAFVAAALFVPVLPANAACGDIEGGVQAGVNCGNNGSVPTSLFGGDGSIFTLVVNILLFVIGAISVLMLIWGGIRYTTSAGNSASVTAAKNTIMYAIIGLIVAFLAFAIVNWVLGSISAKS